MSEWIEIKEKTDVNDFGVGFIGVRNHDELRLINRATLETETCSLTEEKIYYFFIGEHGKALDLNVILQDKEHVYYWLEMPDLPGENNDQ